MGDAQGDIILNDGFATTQLRTEHRSSRTFQGPAVETGSHTHMLFPIPATVVIHSGDYFLFESDSEEEEEALPEDPRPAAQSAFQVR